MKDGCTLRPLAGKWNLRYFLPYSCDFEDRCLSLNTMGYDYEKLISNREDGEARIPDRTHVSNHTSGPLTVLLIALTTFLLGISLGAYVPSHLSRPSIKSLLAPPGDQKVEWSYNKTFGKPPATEVDEAWSSIFPVGRGFVQHPEFAPNISGLAVFHELHCLNALRLSIYEARGESDPSVKSSTGTSPGSHFRHVKHCIDYLRQSLMCHADTNLEPVDWEAGGVTGWGSQRTCRNYQAVVEWANEFRTHDQTDIS